MNKSLYCYFGQLGTNFTVDMPGHMFYQAPLLDAISEGFSVDKFDFYSYIPQELQERHYSHPQSPLGDFVSDTLDRLIDSYCKSSFERLLHSIKDKAYEKIFLKARFRNLSTLTKKWNDAYQFETIIRTALDSGYFPQNIIIIDTDLSMNPDFINHIRNEGVIIEIPTITFNPMTNNFAERLLDIHKDRCNTGNAIYYGNLEFSNYKTGHSKNKIVLDCIKLLSNLEHNGYNYGLTIAGNGNPIDSVQIANILRKDRGEIWSSFETSSLSLNVSKDLYVQEKFVPARVYESLMFGCLPVSYKMPFIFPALSFDNIFEFEEISKFILELSDSDYRSLYEKTLRHFILDK